MGGRFELKQSPVAAVLVDNAFVEYDSSSTHSSPPCPKGKPDGVFCLPREYHTSGPRRGRVVSRESHEGREARGSGFSLRPEEFILWVGLAVKAGSIPGDIVKRGVRRPIPATVAVLDPFVVYGGPCWKSSHSNGYRCTIPPRLNRPICRGSRRLGKTAGFGPPG